MTLGFFTHKPVADLYERMRVDVPKAALPTDRQDRKDIPLYWGLVNYFRDALIGVAKLSMIGNEQHNPGEPLHWAREKGGDELDAQMRHIFELHGIDIDLVPHSVKNAWRALAVCQIDLEENPWTTSVADIVKLMRQSKADGAILDETTPISEIKYDDEALGAYDHNEVWSDESDPIFVVLEGVYSGGPVCNVRGYGPFPTSDAAKAYARVRLRSGNKNHCTILEVHPSHIPHMRNLQC